MLLLWVTLALMYAVIMSYISTDVCSTAIMSYISTAVCSTVIMSYINTAVCSTVVMSYISTDVCSTVIVSYISTAIWSTVILNLTLLYAPLLLCTEHEHNTRKVIYQYLDAGTSNNHCLNHSRSIQCTEQQCATSISTPANCTTAGQYNVQSRSVPPA